MTLVKSVKRRQLRKEAISWAFVLPYLSVFFTFTLLPVLTSIFLSFTDFNLLQTPNFVGAANYVRLFLEDDVFIKSIGNTFLLALITGPLSYMLCLLFAWFINELKPVVRAIVTLVFYAPSISGNMYLIWQVLFSGDAYGYINGMLINLGIITEPIIWLRDTDLMLPIIALVALWTSLGTSFLTFIAGYQGVDKSYYEAGAVDGITNRWQELWYVTLPLMKPQMLLGAVLSITSSFGVGAIVTSMVGFPSTDYAAHTIINHLEDFGTIRYELGYASAIATVLFLIMIISNIVVRRLISKVGN
ncbi:MAG TPA: sugar ABC transporter permease [Bacillota bacterium]|nr:sugar ABC transporter permease [Bacillota bacterium]